MAEVDERGVSVVALDALEQRVAVGGGAAEVVQELLALGDAAADHGLHLLHLVGQLQLLEPLHRPREARRHRVRVLSELLHRLAEKKGKKEEINYSRDKKKKKKFFYFLHYIKNLF